MANSVKEEGCCRLMASVKFSHSLKNGSNTLSLELTKQVQKHSDLQEAQREGQFNLVLFYLNRIRQLHYMAI